MLKTKRGRLRDCNLPLFFGVFSSKLRHHDGYLFQDGLGVHDEVVNVLLVLAHVVEGEGEC